MTLEYLTKSPLETKKLGELLSNEIITIDFSKKAFTIGLIGDLGGGKTTFLQGFAKGLGIKDRILSPTFVILKKFEIDKKSSFKFFYHLDCYRIEKARDLINLDFKKIILDPQNIVVVEWANKVKGLLPKNSLFIDFNFVDDKTRKIKIYSH